MHEAAESEELSSSDVPVSGYQARCLKQSARLSTAQSSSSFRFMDSEVKSVSDFSCLPRVYATKRVQCCDISGARLRQHGWKDATKRVYPVCCDQTGGQQVSTLFKQPSLPESYISAGFHG